MSNETGLTRYDAMCSAIAECLHVDEAKSIRDQARALEVYAAQALNTGAERKATEIRIRAERKAGALLKAMKETGQRQKPGDNSRGVNSRAARPLETERIQVPKLADLGISKDQSSLWQKLANVPEERFEAALKADSRLSTEGIIHGHPPKKPVTPSTMDPTALWLWRWLMDFEEKGIFDVQLVSLSHLMTGAMQEDCVRILEKLDDWIYTD